MRNRSLLLFRTDPGNPAASVRPELCGLARRKWDDRTKAAIKNWHQRTNRPMSNVMSGDDMAYLRTAIPSKSWGGVVYDSKGRYRLFGRDPTGGGR
jgi:hypothetical protein